MKDNRNIRQYHSRKIIWFIILFILILIAVYWGIRAFRVPDTAKRNPDWKSYLSVLNKKEKEKWLSKKQETDGSYMQMNQIVLIGSDGYTADLRLINPPYSACDIEISIKVPGLEDVVYQSGRLAPGTVIEEGRLNNNYSLQEGKAKVYFKFYDGSGKLVGEKELDIEIQQEKRE